MRKFTNAAAVSAITIILAGSFQISTAAAQLAPGKCVTKAGEGTNTTEAGAKFQAWEAVLQATDWSVWAAMMASKQEVGNAPGLKISNLAVKCKAGGLGQICIAQAKLCR